jgi:hypothetical protein
MERLVLADFCRAADTLTIEIGIWIPFSPPPPRLRSMMLPDHRVNARIVRHLN